MKFDDGYLEAMQAVIEALLKEPRLFACALNNASVHGEIFEHHDVDCSEKALEIWYDGIELLLKAGKMMEQGL